MKAEEIAKCENLLKFGNLSKQEKFVMKIYIESLKCQKKKSSQKNRLKN
jgi:hypothetical protein